MKRTDCAECSKKPSVLYCKKHKIPVCAKCGANRHRQCDELMDCADLVKAAQDSIDVIVGNLKKSTDVPKESEKENMNAIKELELLEDKVKEKMSSNGTASKQCMDYVTNKIEDHFNFLTKRGTGNAKALAQLKKRLTDMQQSKDEQIKTYKGEKEMLEDKKGDDMFDVVYKDYLRYQEQCAVGSLGIAEDTWKSLKTQITEFTESLEVQTLLSNLKASFEKPALNGHTNQTAPNFIHYMNPLSQEMYIYDVEQKVGRRVELYLENDKPFTLPEGFDSVAVKGLIYIIGGTTDSENYINDTYEYSFLRERVRQVASLKYARRDHTVEFNEDFIYCIGGRTIDGLTGHCERLPIAQKSKEEDRWVAIPQLSEPRMGPAVCPIRDPVNPILYVFGGLGQSGCVTFIESLLCRNPTEWTKIEIKTCEGWKNRYGAAAVPCIEEGKTNILIFGGSEEIDFGDSFLIDLNSKEMKACPGAKLEPASTFAQRKVVLSGDMKSAYVIGYYDIYCFDIPKMTWTTTAEDLWHPL